MATNREIFFKAVFLEPPVICGRKLRPFSLAHSYFLSYLKNPYVYGGKVSDEFLLNALLVCSMTYRQLRFSLNHQRWFGLALWFALWSFRDLTTASKSFLTYLQEYWDVPDHFEPVQQDAEGSIVEKKEYAAPWQYHLVHILCREYGCTLDEAWDMPITTARCYYDVWSESTGMDNTIVSEFHEASARGEIE